MDALLEFERATKLYGTVIGVNELSLSLAPGGWGLVGPNGAGKTTFLSLVTGLLRPTIGRVRTFGRDPWNDPEVSRRAGLAPAGDLLLRATGLEWVTFLLELRGFRRSAARARAKEALESVGMGEGMGRRMDGYSKGMRQRVKLAQALAHEPELLVLDEPFDGLDPIGRHEMAERLRAWVAGGRSLILASHVLHEVEAVVGSFLLISGGRLLASGPAEEVRALLVEVPSELAIRCDRPAALARALLEAEAVEGLRFAGSRPGEADCVMVETRTPLRVYEALPAAISASGVRVSEVRAKDDSLQALFDSLLKIHRGGAA